MKEAIRITKEIKDVQDDFIKIAGIVEGLKNKDVKTIIENAITVAISTSDFLESKRKEALK